MQTHLQNPCMHILPLPQLQRHLQTAYYVYRSIFLTSYPLIRIYSIVVVR